MPRLIKSSKNRNSTSVPAVFYPDIYIPDGLMVCGSKYSLSITKKALFLLLSLYQLLSSTHK